MEIREFEQINEEITRHENEDGDGCALIIIYGGFTFVVLLLTLLILWLF